jgi:hypothetical protein
MFSPLRSLRRPWLRSLRDFGPSSILIQSQNTPAPRKSQPLLLKASTKVSDTALQYRRSHMPLAKICIVLGGVLSFLMACFHTRFYRMFRWDRDFEKVTLLNHKVLYSIHITLLLLFFLFSF